ncbi:MAG: phosphomannomutase [Proteobacteria bacterium]|nr:MAG: phosphomannomutase [Pseudomonadota bacterium]
MLKLNPVVFREYDIRGTVDKDLSPEFAHLLGRAYAEMAAENGRNNIAIGYDCRLSSPEYAQALARGIADGGLYVTLTGMGPTPQLYFSIFDQQYGGGIQVTGSHNPADMNGFKICLGTQTLSGAQIQEIRQRMTRLLNTATQPGVKKGRIGEFDIQPIYIKKLIENSKPHIGRRKLKIVVDGGNGVGGMVGPQVLRGVGAEVIELYCEPDGRFPNHHPDPTVLENIEELIEKVRETKADFGIGWDGDADRIGVVDEHGQVVFGDMLLLIFGREILKTVPNATIVGDVKCSSLLFDDLSAKGAQAVMWKTGHSLIKGKIKELNAELGGEMSGHIFFKHRYFGFDDALYSSLRLAEIISATDKPFSALLSDLPKMYSTPEIRVECPEEIKFQIPDEIKKAFAAQKVDTTDGARIMFESGWGLVRASNTQPVLVLRFEAQDPKLLEEYKSLVTAKLEEITRTLAAK